MVRIRSPGRTGNGSILAAMDGQDIVTPDRIRMDDLLTRYASAIDHRDWALLDTVFTADAHLDYRTAGGLEGDYPEVRQWLADVLPIFDVTQHLVVNREFEGGDGGARARSCFLNVNRLNVEGDPWQFTVGGQYHDRLVRTADGWRIADRIEYTLWWDNPMPGLPEAPYMVPDLPGPAARHCPGPAPPDPLPTAPVTGVSFFFFFFFFFFFSKPPGQGRMYT